ncbi:hypothetical protein [Phaeobacter sp. 22II1-1F12B]|uniref:hypothetical protein n=1 Tax=Phaeobacter sp. 22II1-1F12B TaxID=1317111 RepID=UPI0018E927CB|nr:hypothetical protein [Phaeobacter sp. 22II1-1F12B]
MSTMILRRAEKSVISELTFVALRRYCHIPPLSATVCLTKRLETRLGVHTPNFHVMQGWMTAQRTITFGIEVLLAQFLSFKSRFRRC